MHIEEIFLRQYPKNNKGIYNCLNKINNEIKAIEIKTYSIRAEDFKEDEILFLSDEENNIINSLRSFDKKNSIFLELGGGNGRFAIKLMQEGYSVIESDIAEGSVDKVKQIAKKNNIQNGAYAIIDSENLPFKNESVDGIFLVASLHHLPNPFIAISEMARVLKKNGQLLILREPASWHYYFFYPIYKIIRKILRKKNNKPISLADDITFGFSKRRLKKLLNPFFKDIKIIPVHYLRKIYTNYIILKSKFTLLNKIVGKVGDNKSVANLTGFTKKESIGNEKIIKILKTIDDKIISRIPFVNNLSWDWDIYAKSKINNF